MSKRSIDLGDLRSLRPVSTVFGQDRGTPIRRRYVERFLAERRTVIRGCVLEVGDDRYSRAYAQPGSRIEVLDPDPKSVKGTLRGDLVSGQGMPDDCFDAVILTQVLHVLPDMDAGLRNVARSLRQGGSLLATLPCVSQVSRYDMDRWGDFWRVTDRGARVLFERSFSPERVEVATFGNVLTAIASMAGLAAEELSAEELDTVDPDYQVLIGVHARK